MARIRSVKPEFWEDEAVGALSPLARLLFIGTWNLADDEGILRWTPDYINASLFMYDDLPARKVAGLMAELEGGGQVFPYLGGASRQRLGYIVRFQRHQRINRPQPGKFPAPSLESSEVRAMYGRRDGWICHLCHAPTNRIDGTTLVAPDGSYNPDGRFDPSLDHVHPRSKGGSDGPSNIRVAHRSCNSAKRDRLPESDTADDMSDSVSDSVSGSLRARKEQGAGSEEQGAGSRDVPESRDDVDRICDHLADRIEDNGSKRPTVTEAWRTAARLLIDRDGRTEEQVHTAIDWCQDHEFWRANVLSMPTLREKYEQLRLQAQRPPSRHSPTDLSAAMARARAAEASA